MSSKENMMAALDVTIRNLNISAELIILIFGTIGNIFNIIIFMSLQIFRKNPCGCCFIILSISDTGALLFHALPDFLANALQGHCDVNLIFPCKIRIALASLFMLLSNFIMCIAAIDQSISTSMPQRHYGLNLKIIQYLIAAAMIISSSHAIPFFIFSDTEQLLGTNDTICRVNDNNGPFSIYATYICLPIIIGILPITIMSVFSFIALCNVHSMRKNHVHVIRLALEEQLTTMVLIKILSVCLTIVPSIAVYTARYIISKYTEDPIYQHQIHLAESIFRKLTYFNCGVSVDDIASFIVYFFN